ncbi:hypothetical protein [Streptomyces sp. Li-HN-5-11]
MAWLPEQRVLFAGDLLFHRVTDRRSTTSPTLAPPTGIRLCQRRAAPGD